MPVVSKCCAFALKFCDRKGIFGQILSIYQYRIRVALWTQTPEYVVRMHKNVGAFREIRVMFTLEAQESPGALTTKTRIEVRKKYECYRDRKGDRGNSGNH
jgi:hypothetical protein